MMNLNKTFLVSICALMVALGTSAHAMDTEDKQLVAKHSSTASVILQQKNITENKTAHIRPMLGIAVDSPDSSLLVTMLDKHQGRSIGRLSLYLCLASQVQVPLKDLAIENLSKSLRERNIRVSHLNIQSGIPATIQQLGRLFETIETLESISYGPSDNIIFSRGSSASHSEIEIRRNLSGRGLVLPEGLSNEDVQVYGRFVEVMTSCYRWADFVRSPSSLNDFITKSLEMLFKEGGKQYKRRTSAQATPSDANPTLISVLRNVIAWKENKDNASVLSQIKAELNPRLTVCDIIPVEQVFSKSEIRRSCEYEDMIRQRVQQLCANPYKLGAEIKRLEKEFPASAEIYKALAPIRTHEAIKKARELNLPNPEEVVNTLMSRFIELRSMYYTYEELVLKGGLKRHMQEFSDKAQASYWNAFDAYSALNASTAAE